MNPVKNGRITASFNEMRPLTAPPSKRWHIHGALDIAGGDGIIRAPVGGIAQGVVIFRGVDPQKGLGSWGGENLKEKREILAFPWRDYWYDTYGGFVVLYESSKRMHLLCHIWASKLLNPEAPPSMFPFRYAYYLEEVEDTRWACHMMFTETTQVKEGQPLARIGSAGYSTGPHVHWEIHKSWKQLDPYGARIDPKEYI